MKEKEVEEQQAPPPEPQGPSVGDLLYALILEVRQNTAVTAYSTLVAMDRPGSGVSTSDKMLYAPLLKNLVGPLFPAPAVPAPQGGEDVEGEEAEDDDHD